MTQLELKNHPCWQNLTEFFTNIDDALAREHLEICDYKVCGYWDEEDKYYEEIILPRNLEIELITSSIGITRNKRFLQVKYFLVSATNTDNGNSEQFEVNGNIGELNLIYDENLEFIDENWLLNIKSPCLVVKHPITEN